jgi:CelD/BcsL family acetyltransferase involved in cellulose biosynthesis
VHVKKDDSIMASELRTDLLLDWPSVYSLEREWNGLIEQSRANIIFLTWEWFNAWATLSDRSIKPFVIVVRDARGALVGLAPFYLARYRLLKILPVRTLRIMADYATGAECLDWIAVRGSETQVCHRIAQAMKAASRRWDCMWMPHVPAWGGASQRIRTTCLAQDFFCRQRSIEFGYVELPETFGHFLKTLSANRRSELRRQHKNLANSHGVTITRCREEADLGRYLDALFDLNHRRWRSRGQDGTFIRKPGEALFYRKFLPVALKKGWLRLYGLEVDGAFKAVQIGYVYNGVFYQMQEGFDPDFIQGAGNVLRARTIEDCISEGLKGYDFLAGMSEHKRRWASTPRMGHHLFVGNRNWKNRLLFFKEVWPTGRYLRPCLLPSANAALPE